MFECACGQIGRSLKAIEGHPLGRNCRLDENGDFELVKSETEEKPVEFADREPQVTRYPKIDKGEVFK